MPATKYELRNGTGTRFMFPEVDVEDIRNNVIGNGSGGSTTTATRPLPGSEGITGSYISCAPCNPDDCSSLLNNCTAAYNDIVEQYTELAEEYNEVVEELEKICDFNTNPPAGSWNDEGKLYILANSGFCDNYFYFVYAKVTATFSTEITFLGNSVGFGYGLIKTSEQKGLYRVREQLYNYPWGPVSQLPPDYVTENGSGICGGSLDIRVALYNPANNTFGPGRGGINATSGIGRYGVFSIANVSRAPGGNYYNAPSLPNTKQLGWFDYLGGGFNFNYQAMEGDPCGDPVPATYNASYTAGINGSITGLSQQVVIPNEVSQQVTAVPNAGYTFTGWSDGSTTNPRIDTNIKSNINVTANFVVTPPAP